MQGNRPLGVRTLTPRRYAGRMLARRLLVLAAVLLALGAVAASLAPRDLRGPATTTVPPAVAPRPSPAPSGSQPVVLSVNAAARRPATVTARVGEHVRLNVRATQPDSVAVLDQTEPVALRMVNQPARIEDPGVRVDIGEVGLVPALLSRDGCRDKGIGW